MSLASWWDDDRPTQQELYQAELALRRAKEAEFKAATEREQAERKLAQLRKKAEQR